MYVLASVCNESAPTWFRALAQFSPCIEDGKLGISALFIQFDGAFIAVTAEGNVWVNGHRLNRGQFPFTDIPGLSIVAEANGVFVENSAGVRFLFRGLGELTVTVPRSFMKQMCGSCGVFGASYAGELLMPDGLVTSDIQRFLRGWLAPEFTSCLN
ncbi:zonadhesin-like [Stegostoma tigrinum]|uniref:zonadhesin-like n=1 Tax=Stegostoma tigrinum TaxID=3053191 RepID=UPI0028708B79|nr:zonadhesin-like [Stegostoma tigrinum]